MPARGRIARASGRILQRRRDVSGISRASRPALLLLKLACLPAQLFLLLRLAVVRSGHEVSSVTAGGDDAFRSSRGAGLRVQAVRGRRSDQQHFTPNRAVPARFSTSGQSACRLGGRPPQRVGKVKPLGNSRQRRRQVIEPQNVGPPDFPALQHRVTRCPSWAIYVDGQPDVMSVIIAGQGKVSTFQVASSTGTNVADSE